MRFQSVGKMSATVGLTAWLIATGPAGAQDLADPPEDQAAFVGESVTFAAEPKFGDMSFQWVRQWPDRDEVLMGETNSSLTLAGVQISDVGFYLCAVTRGDQAQLTRAAALNVCVKSTMRTTSKQSLSLQSTLSIQYGGAQSASYGGGTLTLFGPPVFSAGSQGNCPGSYAGYVNFTRTVSQGWGWAPSTNTTIHTASDATRTDTKVQYVGKYGDVGCNQTSVTIPHPTSSPKYRFTIFFPNNVPTNAYPITLTGFDP